VISEALFSRVSDHWSTPMETYRALDAEFGFTFDPCPLLSTENGLTRNWHGRVFCNPPYSKIGQFIRKGLAHLGFGDCELLVFLVPARTDTAWFHDYVYGKAEVRFLRGRLRFGNAKNSAPFPSMVAIWREWALEPVGFA
jgi:phage N-6-adenine-methyltransferase